MECVRCQSTSVIEGSLIEGTGSGDVLFSSSDTSYMKRIFSVGSRQIRAYACVHCSHLELMVEFTDADRQRYQKFDGPQPDVLDRIG